MAGAFSWWVENNKKNLVQGQDMHHTYYSKYRKCTMYEYMYKASNNDICHIERETLQECISYKALWLKQKNLTW
jgi:hypothetical protein